MTAPENAPRKIARNASRHPRRAPTPSIILTSPRPIASTPRSFFQTAPTSHSEPPPTKRSDDQLRKAKRAMPADRRDTLRGKKDVSLK